MAVQRADRGLPTDGPGAPPDRAARPVTASASAILPSHTCASTRSGATGKAPGSATPSRTGVLPDLAQVHCRPLGLMGEQSGDPARPQHLQLVPLVPDAAVRLHPAAPAAAHRSTSSGWPRSRPAGPGTERTPAPFPPSPRTSAHSSSSRERFPQISGAQLQLAPVEGQDGGESGLAALVSQRQQVAHAGPRRADPAAEGKLDRRGALGRALVQGDSLPPAPRAPGRVRDRLTAQDAGPGE